MNKLMLLVILSSMAIGQSISPVIVECGKKCSGQLEVSNNGLTPMSTVLELHSFEVKDHKPILRSLDPSTTVKLSEYSSKLRAGETHSFDYKITCDHLPCPVAIYVVMSTGKPNKDGVVVKLALPHMIYVCEKKKDCRKSVLGD